VIVDSDVGKRWMRRNEHEIVGIIPGTDIQHGQWVTGRGGLVENPW